MDEQVDTPEAPGPEGAAPEVQATEHAEVQPDAGSPDPSQTSQGLIEPYLEDLDPLTRERVAPVLERFRADQDARVNEKIRKESERRKAYEQYGEPEQVAVATQIMNSFIADPVATTRWLAEQAKDEFGVDILTELSASVEQAREEHAASGDPEPLTAEKVLELLEQREQQQQQQARLTAAQEQQRQAAAQRAANWFEESVGRHKIPAEALTDGLKQAMFVRANEIKNSGLAADGRTAIDMAVAEIGQAFSKVGAPAPPAPEPKVANGGSAPPPEDFDVTDPAMRKQAMLDRLTALTGG